MGQLQRPQAAPPAAPFRWRRLRQPALADYFRTQRLHEQVVAWRPALPADAAPLPAQAEPPSRFAFIGGSFRWRALCETVLPALIAAAPPWPVTLFLRSFRDRALDEAMVARCRAAGIAIERFPFELSYDAFQRRMRAAGIEVVLHPAGDSGNVRYKSLATIVAARAIGALPMVAREGPFGELGEADGVIVLPDETAAWRTALARLLAAPNHANALRASFDRHCRATYSGTEGGAFLADALRRYAPDAPTLETRRARLHRRRLPDSLIRKIWRWRGH